MCTSVGGGSAFLVALLVLGVPLALLPLAGAVAAHRRPTKRRAAVAALLALLGALVAWLARPSDNAPRIDETWHEARRLAFLAPLYVLPLGALLLAAAPRWRPAAALGLAVVGVAAAAVLVGVASFLWGPDSCPYLMAPPTPAGPASG